jgi:hypothetical protein
MRPEICEILLAFGADAAARNSGAFTPAQVYAEKQGTPPPMDPFVARISGKDYRPPLGEEVARKYVAEKAEDEREMVSVDGEDLVERRAMFHGSSFTQGFRCKKFDATFNFEWPH